MTMTLLAHSAHWLIDLLYVAPFIGLLIWLFVTTLKERRRAAREDASQGPEN